MKIEKDNQKFYRSTFDKVHASDELVGKVKNMTKVEAKKKMYVIKKVLCIAAVVAALFAVSNFAVYAATGESWVEMLVVRVIVNGEDMDVNVKKITEENGDVKYALPITIEGETTVDEDGTTYEYTHEFDVEIENPENIGRIEVKMESSDSTLEGVYVGENEIAEFKGEKLHWSFSQVCGETEIAE